MLHLVFITELATRKQVMNNIFSKVGYYKLKFTRYVSHKNISISRKGYCHKLVNTKFIVKIFI